MNTARIPRRLVGRVRSALKKEHSGVSVQADTESMISRIREIDADSSGPNASRVLQTFQNAGYSVEAVRPEFWSLLTKCLRASSEEVLGVAGQLVKEIEGTRSDALSSSHWVKLMRLCQFQALYSPAYALRERAKRAHCVDSVAKESRPSEPAQLEVMLDDGEWEQVYERCSGSDITMLQRNQAVSVKRSIGKLLGTENSETDGSDDFCDQVAGRVVVLLGPAAAELELPGPNGANPLFAGLNLRSGAIPSGLGAIGADISYYSNVHGKLVADEKSLSGIDIDWFVVKNRRTQERMARDGVHARILENPGVIFFNADFNLIPLAVTDLLLAGAHQVHVSCADLMLSKDRTEGYYPDEIAAAYRADSAFSRSSVVHDPATQYNLLWNLFKRRRITGDKRFNEVMSLGCKEYMNQLQTMYAPSIAGTERDLE